jgi:phosphoenolpyruvate carboxylase
MSAPVARTAEEWFAILRGEVNELGRALGDAIRTLSGEDLYAKEEAIRALTKESRRGGDTAAARLQDIVASLSIDDAEGLLRAFSVYLHLATTAE